MQELEAGTTSEDEELDVSSDKFNPLKALYSDKIKFPSKNRKKFDNLSSFISHIKKAGNALDANLDEVSTHSKKKANEADVKDKDLYHVTEAGRRFLKNQAPVHRGRKAKLTRDIFSRMENSVGPIELLKKFKKDHTRVKVYTRKEHGIRGFMTGFIIAFDKHFNIALVDCVETWNRRKFKYSENNVANLGQPEDCSKLLNSMGIKVPELSVKSLDRKNVECTRKISQIVIRGEEVVLVGEDKKE